MKKILIAIPYHSSFKDPLIHAFNKMGYLISEVDYRFLRGNLSPNLEFFQLFFWNLWTVSLKLINPDLASRFQNKVINRYLVSRLKQQKPDVLFVVKGENINLLTIKKAKHLGIYTILWQVDPVFHPKIWPWFKIIGPHYDAVIICEEGRMKAMQKLGWKSQILHMLAAADYPDQSLVNLPKKYDVSFVGTNNPDRERYLSALTNFDLNIWGYGFEKTKLNKFFKGVMPYKNLLSTYAQSKIVLATTQSPYISANNRVFEAGSVGAFVLIEYNKYLSQIFTIGTHLDCFRTAKELRAKVGYYLKNEGKRYKMAQNLKKEVFKKHIYEKRLKEIFKQISNEKG